MGIFDIFRISQIKKENADLRAANAEMIRVKQENENLTASLLTSKEENKVLLASNEEMMRRANESGITEYYQAKERIDAIEAEITSRTSTITQLREENESLQEKQSKLEHSLASSQKKLSRSKELYKSINYSVENFFNSDHSQPFHSISAEDSADLDLIAPSVELKLHCMDMKSLRQAYRENEKVIKDVLARYSSRYTTKANRTIYDLMVIALQAELQNILTALKYDKLDKAVDNVKTVTAKYLKIAAEGNQSIAGTLTKFIGEIEYLFINAVKIEYNYYVKKEQAKQEQLEIRQKMREEAEERKALEAERKKIEKEESKFHTQIAALTEQANASSGDELEALRARILELQSQLADVVVKKEEISNLQNGKAGNVYIISNLGSFGDDVFKIGMTRRLDPQDRVNELGDASVPFKFDVHSFIFSDDASSLETELHKRLDDRRVNKVNVRKEFFRVSIDELEQLVMEICPTAEFNRTMLAEEFYQSQSADHAYSSDFSLYDDEDEDE